MSHKNAYIIGLGLNDHLDRANSEKISSIKFIELKEDIRAPATNNPYLPSISKSVLPKLKCCSAVDGGAVAVLASDNFICQHGLDSKPIEIDGMETWLVPANLFTKEPAINQTKCKQSTWELRDLATRHGANVKINLTAAAKSSDGFKVTPLLQLLEQAMYEDQDNLIEKVRAVYGFKVTNGPKGNSGFWVINAKDGKGKITFNGTEKCDITFIISDEDVFDLITGKLPPQKAFFQGKVKIQGNIGLAMRLLDLQRSAQDRIETLRSKL